MASEMHAALLALDWGTTSLRAYLLDRGGIALAVRSADWGVMRLPQGDFAGALEALCGDWLAANPGLPTIASGMVGSKQGWLEVPYVSTPASADVLAQGLRQVQGPKGIEVAIVPGVMQGGARPNVMRGEETQVVGALALVPELLAPDGLIVLPGTHSKWVQVRDGCITSFLTFMTGELYSVLREHSILGRLMQDTGVSDAQGFDLGLQDAAQPDSGGLLSSLFSVRTLGLTQRLRPEQLGDYLSGLLIGHEIREARALCTAHDARPRPLTIVGAPALCQRYVQALSSFALPMHDHDLGSATQVGLWTIACRAGLVANETLPC